jgi:iron complex transport system permease protein
MSGSAFTASLADGEGVFNPLTRRRLLAFGLMGGLVVILVSLNISIGSISYPLGEVWSALLSPDAADDLMINAIIWKVRLPRAIAAALGGAYLAASGLLLQVYFRNPIVGPYILGISSGATVTVSVVMLTSIGLGFSGFSPYLTTLAACLGAYGVTFMVVAIANRVKSIIYLLIVGLMVGYLCGAVSSILTALAEQERIKGFVLWSMGSFSGFKWSEIWVMVFFGGALMITVYLLSKPLNALLLGADYAASMGVNIRRFRVFILLAASSLAGLVTSMAGPVAFIGLAVPHMARLSLKTSDNRVLIPGACLMGALVTSLCDLIARMWLSPVELPLSAITSFFGAPIVITLLLKRSVRA